MGERIASVTRNTKETKIQMTLNLDGTGKAQVETGIGFLNHMLEGFAKHGFFDLTVQIEGDLIVDGHHTVEDCGIVLGQAIKEALGDKKGIKRFGNFILPMDESLVLCALDLSNRPYFMNDCKFHNERVGYLDIDLIQEFFYSVSYSAGMNLHFKELSGGNDHHLIEAMFKAFGKALDQAVSYDSRIQDVLSTKGTL